MEVEDLNQQTIFIVASVQSPLVSLGRLLAKGWSMGSSSAAEAGVTLISPDKMCSIPLKFKRHSLAMEVHIRMVNYVEDKENYQMHCPIVPIDEGDEPREEECLDYVVVQTVMDVKQEILDMLFRRGWNTTSDGNPFCIIPETTKFLNPSFLYPWSEWPKRSTLVQRADFKWEVIEHCVPYYTKMDYEGEIEESNGVPKFVLTMLRKKDEPLTVLGTLGLEEEAEAGGSHVESPFEFPGESAVPPELQEGLQPEEIEQLDPGGALPPEANKSQVQDADLGDVNWTLENKESLVVNGEVIRANSSVGMLRAAADFIGVHKGGSKRFLWDRLNQAVQKKEHLEMFKAANNLYRQEEQPDGMVPQSCPVCPRLKKLNFAT